jgi:tetratricopeptide (TPR) repeat protein
MKKYIILLLILSAGLSRGADLKSLMDQANKAYADQNFTKAEELYEQLLGTGQESAQLYFNLGNTCFKKGENLRAILFFERAKRLAPQNPEIDFNLKIANQFVVDNIEQLPKTFFARGWSSLANHSSSDGWAKWSVSFFILFLLLLGTYLFSPMPWIRRTAFYAAVFSAVFVVLTFALASKQYNVIMDKSSALIFCPNVTVKSAPSVTSTNLFLIHEGLKVKITDQLEKWKEIELADGNKGWVADSCLVRI